MHTIISFFQKLIKGGVGIRAGGLEIFSKINKRRGDDYSVLESTWPIFKIKLLTYQSKTNCDVKIFCFIKSLIYRPKNQENAGKGFVSKQKIHVSF